MYPIDILLQEYKNPKCIFDLKKRTYNGLKRIITESIQLTPS